jgi:6-phosphogluconate dehydrogenase
MKQIGLIGLGKMGFNLALNLQSNGYQVVAYDKQPETTQRLGQTIGNQALIIPSTHLPEFCQKLTSRRVIWLMIPAGKMVDEVIEQLLPYLQKNDILIDGGNSYYQDSIRRYNYLKTQEIDFLDCGTSGGLNGALNGACTMVGGEKAVFDDCAEVFEKISLSEGCLYCGKAGSGHFVKMVHNGIEYGMMQAIAEGFEVLEQSDFDLNLEAVAKVWNHGSVVRSWLMELMQNALQKDAHLTDIKGIMHSSGEGKWTLETALDMGIPTPVIALSVLMRYRSQQSDTFAGKVVAALRNEFGGHPVEKNDNNV